MQTLIDSVVEDIYEAAADAAHFPKMFESVCKAVGASRGIFMLLGANSEIFHTYNHDPELMQMYNTVYLGVDPLYKAAMERNVRHLVMTGQELVPTKEFEHTDYYQDCLAPAGVYDGMSITLESTSTMNAGLAVQRSRNEPLFNRADKKVLEYLVPHLRRMVRIRRTFEHQASLAALGEDAVDHLAFGVVILNSDGRITFANKAAENLLSSGDRLFSCNGRLAAHEDKDALARALAFALAVNGASATGSELCIGRRSGRRPLILQITPVDLSKHGQFILTPASSLRGAVVAIIDPETQQPKPTASLLRQMFGLTPAESAVAVRLGEGQSVREIAADLRIGEGTARWHLKNVQEKTDTHRQSELVGLVARLAPKMNREN